MMSKVMSLLPQVGTVAEEVQELKRVARSSQQESINGIDAEVKAARGEIQGLRTTIDEEVRTLTALVDDIRGLKNNTASSSELNAKLSELDSVISSRVKSVTDDVQFL
jgi:predicted RNase H-like nuclease (RuvC/YqgF family)